jgi:hypothetical protein
MHPELLSRLATEHRRDLDAALTTRPVRSARAGWRFPRLTLPRYRVSLMTLAAVAGRSRGRSLVIVISATRPAAGPPAVASARGDRGALIRAL